MDLPPPRGELSMDRVGVRIRGQFALVNATLTLSPGEVLGVLGPSGAGKSTLARVAANALAPEAGVVRLDGANLADWDPDALGRHIGYLPQEIGLLAGTIAENIRRFNPSISGDPSTIDPEVIAARDRRRRARSHPALSRRLSASTRTWRQRAFSRPITTHRIGARALSCAAADRAG
ncbi:MAG: ATP-binding cassette domain-containing protein [Terricaulis sp.]